MAASLIKTICTPLSSPSQALVENDSQEPRLPARRNSPPYGMSVGRIWTIKTSHAAQIPNIDLSKGLRVVLVARGDLGEEVRNDFEWPKGDGCINAITRQLFHDKFGIDNIPALRRAGALSTYNQCVVVMHHNICKRGSHPQTIFVNVNTRNICRLPLHIQQVYQDKLYADIVSRGMQRLERMGAVSYHRTISLGQWLHSATVEERALQALERQVERRKRQQNIDRVLAAVFVSTTAVVGAARFFNSVSHE